MGWGEEEEGGGVILFFWKRPGFFGGITKADLFFCERKRIRFCEIRKAGREALWTIES